MEIIWQSYGNHQIPRLNFNQQMQLQMHQALEQTRWPLRRAKPVGFWTKNNGVFLGVFLLGFLKSSWCFSLISYTKIRETCSFLQDLLNFTLKSLQPLLWGFNHCNPMFLRAWCWWSCLLRPVGCTKKTGVAIFTGKKPLIQTCLIQTWGLEPNKAGRVDGNFWRDPADWSLQNPSFVSLLMGDFLVDTFIEHKWHDLYKKTLSPWLPTVDVWNPAPVDK